MKRIAHTKETIVEAIRHLSQELRRAPSGPQLEAQGISKQVILARFGTLREAVEAAGFEFRMGKARIPESFLLEDWGRAVRALGELPSTSQYDDRGRYSSAILRKRYGKWQAVPFEFLAQCGTNGKWADVCQVVRASIPAGHPGTPPETASKAGPRLAGAKPGPRRHFDRPTCGNPTGFPGMSYEPVNENGVVFLFGAVAKQLGFQVESVQAAFPDCAAKREIAPGKWQRVRIEFEFESRKFREQRHPVHGCDVIVCWRDNWPKCPLEVVELATAIKGWRRNAG